MASLKLGAAPLPRPEYDDEPLPTTKLTRFEPPETTEHYFITDLELLVYGEETTVYKGSIQERDTPKPTPVVIKTDFYAPTTRPSVFQHEADIYELELEEVQGISIPRCFGLFQHTKGNRISSFLVLDYCGEALLDERKLSKAFKGKALAKLYKIHHAGYTHGDICLDNITDRDGEPFFIDFESAEPHKCELREKIFVGEEWRPIPCDEMDECAALLDAWATENIQFLSDCVFQRSEVRPDTIGELLAKLKLFDYDVDELRPLVERLIQDVEAHRKYYRDLPPQERLIFPDKPDA